jgi:hypothetical protein
MGRAGDLGRVIVAGPEAEIAVPIHRRDGADERVDADLFSEQSRRLMKVVGNLADDLAAAVRHAALDQRTFGPGDEHAVGSDAFIQLVPQHRCASDRGRLKIVDPQILDQAGLGTLGQGLQERGRLGRGMPMDNFERVGTDATAWSGVVNFDW